jgi:hypothetical protein
MHRIALSPLLAHHGFENAVLAKHPMFCHEKTDKIFSKLPRRGVVIASPS